MLNLLIHPHPLCQWCIHGIQLFNTPTICVLNNKYSDPCPEFEFKRDGKRGTNNEYNRRTHMRTV